MNYWELRSFVSKLVPRSQLLTKLEHLQSQTAYVQEKGRKKNYQQFDLVSGKMVPIQRLLSKDEIKSFVEVSLRAAHCPMPLNADVWDGLLCIAKGQLILTEMGPKPIEEIQVGDRVWSFNLESKEPELKMVTNSLQSSKEEIVELETENGILRMSLDHPVYTKRGWVKAADLNEEDEVLYLS